VKVSAKSQKVKSPIVYLMSADSHPSKY